MKFFHACRGNSPNYGKQLSEDDLMCQLFDAHELGYDIETPSLKDRTPIGFALAISPDDAFYFPTDSPYVQMIMESIIGNRAKTIIMHNAMFDMDITYKYWHTMAVPCEDTMLMCAHQNWPLKLEDAAYHIGRHDVTSAQTMLAALKKEARTMTALDQNKVAEKCCIDAQTTVALCYELRDKCNYEPYHIDRTALPILIKAQAKGLRVDQGVRRGIEETLDENIAYYKALCDGHGFNPASPQQVAFTLANRGVLLPLRWNRQTKKMKVTTTKETLEKLTDPLAQAVLLYRQDTKLRSTYVLPLEGQDRAYTHFHMSTITGRLGSANMNLQNWPEKIRMMIIPDEDDGELTNADANQIELRMLAHVSQDPVMMAIFADPNGDIHAETMKALGITIRKLAKNVNFGMIFGGQPEAIDQFAKCGIARAAEFMELWFDRYKKAHEYIVSTQEYAQAHHHTVTPMGRKIFIEEFLYPDKLAEALRMAINYPIQGGAAEINKKSMPLIDHLDFRLQVHDNFMFNGRVELPDLSHVVDMYTPYKVTYTRTWE